MCDYVYVIGNLIIFWQPLDSTLPKTISRWPCLTYIPPQNGDSFPLTDTQPHPISIEPCAANGLVKFPLEWNKNIVNLNAFFDIGVLYLTLRELQYTSWKRNRQKNKNSFHFFFVCGWTKKCNCQYSESLALCVTSTKAIELNF